jgi:hypothetical protein
MREPRSLRGLLGAFHRHAGASLALASLFALYLIQPFHAPAPIGAATHVLTTAGAIGSGLPVQPGTHDPDTCPVCRATTQTRLGLRSRVHAHPVALPGPSVALHLPAPAPEIRAPELHHTSPRAPPTPLLALSA